MFSFQPYLANKMCLMAGFCLGVEVEVLEPNSGIKSTAHSK